MYTGKYSKLITTLCWSTLSVFSNFIVKGTSQTQCGGTLMATRGILQTPSFPNEFRVPILCKWVIDATEISTVNTSIVVYLTQLFVLEGLSFEEYETYDQSYNILGKQIHVVLENNVSKVRWVRTHQNVLVVTFQLQSLENTHLRILDYFLDVYGFNMTYEITTEPIRTDSCIMGDCGFTGICYDDFTTFHCQCFPGYSGPTCSNGSNSLCNSDGANFCQNGGTCRHVGTTSVICDCPGSYTGDQCQKRVRLASKHECNGKNLGQNCTCFKEITSVTGSKISDGSELSTTFRLMQGPTLRKEDLLRLLQNQIAAFKLNISPENVRVTEINYYDWGTEATVHFYGLKRERKRIEALINRWTHGGHIGNLTLIDRNISLRNDSLLFIKSISINQVGPIREGDQFILSCVAQGTPSTSFRWFKDGLTINVTQSTSNKWFRLIQDPQIRNQYTSLIGVDKASYLDEGMFVCEAEDYGIKQCLSRNVEIRRPPNVKIEPMSLTVQKGENFTIKCICLSNKNQNHKYTYSWTKNKELLPIKTEMEKYEILFPGGSILQVSRIEKPAAYSCLVQGEVSSTEVSIQVDVVDRTLVHTCRGEKHMNILWPETAPGTQSVQECPKGFTGIVRRWCILHDPEKSVWQLPDFSMCTADSLVRIDDNFQRLHLGYGQGNGRESLENYQTYTKKRSVLLPGEGARILGLTSNVVSYINISNDFSAIYNVTNTLFAIIDNIMKHNDAIISQAQVLLLQQVIRNQIHFSEQILKTSSVYHKTFSSIDVGIAAARKLNSIPKIPFEGSKYPHWYGYELEISPNSRGEITYLNESLILTCVVFKNLSAFLPKRSAVRLRDGAEMEYEVLSNVVSVWLLKQDKLMPDTYKFSFAMEFTHPVVNTTMTKWSLNCSAATYASYGDNWDVSWCYTKLINSTNTRCICLKPGTYAVLITSIPLAIAEEEYHSYQTFVYIGCCFCLLFSVIAEIILITHWILQKSSITFLKIQYCFALANAMAVFVVALSIEIPIDVYPYINTFLEIFLLIALSSHISKCLIVFTDLVQLSKAQNMSKTVVAISTGVPVITVFASHLTHRTMGKRQPSWWLINGSVSFNIFIIAFLIIIFLYNIMYLMVMEKLSQCGDKPSALVLERKRLLRRSFYIFWATVITICSSIMYINMKEFQYWNYTFALSNVLLVAIFFTCYILKPESPLLELFSERFKLKPANKFPTPPSERSPVASKQDSEYDKQATPNRSKAHRPLSNAKSSIILLSDLQNIPTYTRNHPSEAHTSDNSTNTPSKDQQCVKECVNAQRQQRSCTLHKKQEYYKASDLQEYMYSPDVVATRVHVELDLVTPIIHDSSYDHQTRAVPEENPIILCNIAVNSRCEINQKSFPPYTETTQEKISTENLENATKTHTKCERVQPEGVETLPLESNFKCSETPENSKSTQVTEQQKPTDSLDGMLDKISHDLDYLLNRKNSTEEPGECTDTEEKYQIKLHTHTF